MSASESSSSSSEPTRKREEREGEGEGEHREQDSKYLELEGEAGPLAGKGHIQLILGPMFSGKTTELIRRIVRFQIAKLDCAIIKYAADTRYSIEEAATHDSRTIKAIPCTKLNDVFSQVKCADVVGIDEGQFFSDVVEFSDRLANEGKIVIVAALDGTFQRRPFGSVLELVPLAESVHKLSAVCTTCFQSAAFTKRIGTDQRIEVIGGAESYVAVCRRCFYSLPVTPHSPSVSFKRSRLNHALNPPVSSNAQLFQQ